MGQPGIGGFSMAKDRRKKLAEREKRYACLARKRRQGKVLGTCLDCGESCFMEDQYMVTNEVWAEAGMTPRSGKEDLEGGRGWLHLACLEKRLARKVTEEELLTWCVGKDKGGYDFKAVVDIWERPEHLDWI
jgi:hypothetical protein